MNLKHMYFTFRQIPGTLKTFPPGLPHTQGTQGNSGNFDFFLNSGKF